MLRLTISLSFLLMFSLPSFAQFPVEFKVVNYSKGYYVDHKPIQQVKIPLTKKSLPLASADWDGDGVSDTLFYRRSNRGGDFATVVYLDKSKDDWVTLYKYDLNGMEGTESIWFIEEQLLANSPQHEYVIYTGFKDDKSFSVIGMNPQTHMFEVKVYKVHPKNYYEHKLVSNKAMIINQNGASVEEFEEIEIK